MGLMNVVSKIRLVFSEQWHGGFVAIEALSLSLSEALIVSWLID